MKKLHFRTKKHDLMTVSTSQIYCFPEDLLEVYAWGDAKIGFNKEAHIGSFEDCKYNFKLPKEAPNLHTDLSHMFGETETFNQSLANWDTSNVTNMSFMFYRAKAFNQSVSNFDTSNVINMAFMFCDAKAFNQSVEHFDISKVTDMQWVVRRFPCKKPSWYPYD